MILGDSLSAAYNIAIEESWPQLFRELLRAEIPQSTVTNASISGETTHGGLQRLPALLNEYQPDILIIELGGNDGLRGLKFKQTKANIMSMIELANKNQTQILLISVRLPPNLGTVYNQRFQKIFLSISESQPIYLLPKFLEGIAATKPELMQVDGIHPTALAQPLLAKKVFDNIIPLITR